MTEAEAKTKLCFKAATFSASQQLADGPGPHCIGSACMAWRWKIILLQQGPANKLGGPRLHDTYGPSPTDGFCGLAGAPQ